MESHGVPARIPFQRLPGLLPLSAGERPLARQKDPTTLSPGKTLCPPCQPQATGRLQAGRAQVLGCPQAARGDGPSTLLPVCPSICCRGCPGAAPRGCPVWPKGLGVQQGLGWRLWLPCGHCPPHSCAGRICPHCSRPCSHPPDTPGVPPSPETCALHLHGPGPGSSALWVPSASPPFTTGEALKPGPTPRRSPPGRPPTPAGSAPGLLSPPGAELGPSYVSAGSFSKHSPRRRWGCRQGPQGTGLNLWGHQSPPLTLQLNPRTRPLSCSPPGARRRAKSEALT